VSFVEFTHPASAGELDDLVRTQPCPWGERHGEDERRGKLTRRRRNGSRRRRSGKVENLRT
jgi:hypothetical protein